MYRSENGALSKSEKLSITTAEVYFLRPGSGYTVAAM
jgi:hypothetical protein